LLHAQSGAGKTSLLNAIVIPDLERRGWTPVRILPHNDPLASARSALLQHTMPPPDAELCAIDRAMAELGNLSLDLTLDDLLARYDREPVTNLAKRIAIEPIDPAAECAKGLALTAKVTPYFCRVLRATLDIEGFADHIAAVYQGGQAEPAKGPRVSGETRLKELREHIASARFRDAHSTLLRYLDPPSDHLWDFLANLLQVYGARRGRFGLVLLFDQFEELFTRFIDPGKMSETFAADLPDWRLRYRFLDELEAALGAQSESAVPSDAGADPALSQPLPIRYVISMRSEYVAQLAPVRQFVPEIEQSIHHLELLSRGQALNAIQEPAAKFGFTFEKKCYERIIDDLLKEDRFVEPAHLSLVCEKLWDAKGSQIREATRSEGGALPQIRLESYETELEGARGILRRFLRDFLASLPDANAQVEALELLEPLITGSGTRNIVARDLLIHVPYRKPQLRSELLSKLVNHTIVRVEMRLGGEFVEITHEFLIPSVRELMQELIYADATQYRFRTALRALARQEPDEIYLGIKPNLTISERDFEILDQNRSRIEWSSSSCAIELMFRASVFFGGGRDTLKFWADAFTGNGKRPDVKLLLDRMERGELRRDRLGPEELREVNERREELRLSPKQIEIVFRSHVRDLVTSRPDQIRYWVGRIAQ
jgi:conflict system STAND superfamily ATPase